MNDFDWDIAEQDVRPFFGELPETVGESLRPSRQPRQESHTPAEWRELKIADGLCPMVGCGGTLDEDLFCSTCGNTSLPRPVEDEPLDELELPVYPVALSFDEYAPTSVDEAA